MALTDYVENKPVIETERLIIREMVPDDIPALRQWMGDEQIYVYWGKGPSKAEKHPELLFIDPRPDKSRKLSHDYLWGVELNSKGPLVKATADSSSFFTPACFNA